MKIIECKILFESDSLPDCFRQLADYLEDKELSDNKNIDVETLDLKFSCNTWTKPKRNYTLTITIK